MTATVLRPARFPWFDYTRYSFSLGLAAGGRSYLSGHTASTFDAERRKMVVPGGMEEQTRIAYAKVEAILEAEGRGLGDVARIVEYVTPRGIERYAEAEGVRRELFGDHAPCVNTAPVGALLREDALIEIEAIAGPVGPATGESAGLVFLPTIHPLDAAGEIPGSLIAQTELVHDKAATMLAALGLGFADLVKSVDYVTSAALPDYRETARVRRDRLGPVYPTAVGIIMPRLIHPGAMIQLDLIAARDTPVAVDPGWPRYEKLTYSPGVRAGGLVFVSGVGAIDPESGKPHCEGDVAGQAEFIYANVRRVVEAAGGGIGDLVKTIEYTTPAALPRYREVAGVRARLLEEPYPASTGPVCEALLRPEMLIEIDSLAVLS